MDPEVAGSKPVIHPIPPSRLLYCFKYFRFEKVFECAFTFECSPTGCCRSMPWSTQCVCTMSAVSSLGKTGTHYELFRGEFQVVIDTDTTRKAELCAIALSK